MRYDADRFWSLMKKQGRTMTWLANATGYNRTYIHLMRSGAKPITEQFIGKASAALGLPSDVLFTPCELTKVSKTLIEESVAD